jgi:hypothetical protein
MSDRDEFERFVTDKFFDIEKDHIGYTSWATAFAWKVWQDTRAAARATPQQAVPAPVARLHITETDEWPDIRVEVLNGENLQPSMSPVDVYAAPQPSQEQPARQKYQD